MTDTETKTGELIVSENVTTMTAAPVAQSLSSLAAALGNKYKIKKQVTRTVLQQKDGVPFAVTIQTEIYQGQELGQGRGGAPKMQPARLIEVLNLESGELQLLIANTVLEGELIRAYPELGYVGKSFLIRPKAGGDNSEGKKRLYKVYEIAELEIEGETVSGEIIATGENPVNRAGVEVAPQAEETKTTKKK